MQEKTVLLISTDDNAPEYLDRLIVLQNIASAIGVDGVQVDAVLMENLIFSVVDNKPDIKIRHSGRSIVESGNTNLSQYDLVYIKNWESLADIASAIALYLDFHKVRVICEEVNYFRSVSKASESFILALNDIPYPDTLFCAHTEDLFDIWQERSDLFPMPLIIKAVDGFAGNDNFLVHSEYELRNVLNGRSEVRFMIQNFIPNDSDYRVVMLGFEPVMIMQRKRRDESTHLNNTSQGAEAILQDISSFPLKVLDDCRKSSHLVRREIAGVDVMFNSETGEHIILEVNASPQLATGAFLTEKKEVMRQYFNQILNESGKG